MICKTLLCERWNNAAEMTLVRTSAATYAVLEPEVMAWGARGVVTLCGTDERADCPLQPPSALPAHQCMHPRLLLLDANGVVESGEEASRRNR